MMIFFYFAGFKDHHQDQELENKLYGDKKFHLFSLFSALL